MKTDLKKFFGDISKKGLIYILGAFGVLLLAIPSCEKESAASERESGGEKTDYCLLIEKRLEEILPKIAGVGNVDVMVTAENYGEIRLAEDKNEDEAKTIVLNQKGGGEDTKIVEEKYPRLQGVVIAADGGKSDIIKEELTDAVTALLGVEAHKIKVFERNSGQ